MAARWMREITVATTPAGGTGTLFSLRCLAIFLCDLCGWTWLGETIGNSSGSGTIGGKPTVTLSAPGFFFDPGVVGRKVSVACAFEPEHNNVIAATISARPSATTIQYTNNDPDASGGACTWTIVPVGSFANSSGNGTAGEWNLTGTDKQFRDTAYGAFGSGDTGKWMAVRGNDRTIGIYRVTYVSATTVSLDFRSGTNEFPDQQTGLTWLMFSDEGVASELPIWADSYFKVRSPKGWEVEFMYQPLSLPDRYSIRVRVATDSSWTEVIGTAYICTYTGKTNWWYAQADPAGDWFHFMAHQSTDNLHNGVFVSTLVPVESGLATKEKVYLCGCNTQQYSTASFVRSYSDLCIGRCAHWDALYAAAYVAYMLDPTYNTSALSLVRHSTRERNRRRSGSQVGNFTGDSLTFAGGTVTLVDATATFVAADVGKKIRINNATNPGNNGVFVVATVVGSTTITFANALGVTETSTFGWSMDYQDVLDGTLVVNGDVNNSSGRYQIMGRLLGHYSTRGGTAAGGWAVRKAFDEDGVLDKFHWTDGFSLDWPGVTPQH